jgi:tryptophan synthase alpha chain
MINSTNAPKVSSAFKGGKKAFIAFMTAGDPTIKDSLRYLNIVQDYADLVEVGIPFSDPIAEGVVIQEADLRSLNSGTTLEKVFDMVAGIQKKVPFVFMTYANPVFYYGYERFFARCVECGISGVIIPDIPFEESEEVKCVAVKYGIDVIDMVAPTSNTRIKKVCSQSKGFIYLVSSLGVTGMRKEINTDISSIVKQIRAITTTPVCVGFGISSPRQAKAMASSSDGAIMGSAIVRIIAENGANADEKLKAFLSDVSRAVHE